jgi:hypothetical protein
MSTAVIEVAKVLVQTRVPEEVKKRLQREADERGLELYSYLCNFLTDPKNVIVAKVPAIKPRKVLTPAVVLDDDVRKILANLGDSFDQIARGISAIHSQDELKHSPYYLGRLIEAQLDLHRLVKVLLIPKETNYDD